LIPFLGIEGLNVPHFVSVVDHVQQLGGSSQGKHTPSCIEFGKFEINSWYSSPFPRDLAKYVYLHTRICSSQFVQ